MAFENLGLSFLPRGEETGGAEQGGARLEDVLRILSFRLPRVLGARPIAPAELLNAQGGMNNPLGGAIAQAIVQNLRGGMPGMPSMNDPGAPSSLGSIFGPVLGPNPQPQDIPAPSAPRVIPIEPPVESEPTPSLPRRDNVYTPPTSLFPGGRR